MPESERLTHYCDDCDIALAILYDDREDTSVPIVCGHCGGTNTRRLDPAAPVCRPNATARTPTPYGGGGDGE